MHNKSVHRPGFTPRQLCDEAQASLCPGRAAPAKTCPPPAAASFSSNQTPLARFAAPPFLPHPAPRKEQLYTPYTPAPPPALPSSQRKRWGPLGAHTVIQACATHVRSDVSGTQAPRHPGTGPLPCLQAIECPGHRYQTHQRLPSLHTGGPQHTRLRPAEWRWTTCKQLVHMQTHPPPGGHPEVHPSCCPPSRAPLPKTGSHLKAAAMHTGMHLCTPPSPCLANLCTRDKAVSRSSPHHRHVACFCLAALAQAPSGADGMDSRVALRSAVTPSAGNASKLKWCGFACHLTAGLPLRQVWCPLIAGS
jgi:hypothetical protein